MHVLFDAYEKNIDVIIQIILIIPKNNRKVIPVLIKRDFAIVCKE